MTLNAVVLPAPFGPISPAISPSSTVERELVEREDPAEAPADVVDLEQRHRR